MSTVAPSVRLACAEFLISKEPIHPHAFMGTWGPHLEVLRYSWANLMAHCHQNKVVLLLLSPPSACCCLCTGSGTYDPWFVWASRTGRKNDETGKLNGFHQLSRGVRWILIQGNMKLFNGFGILVELEAWWWEHLRQRAGWE